MLDRDVKNLDPQLIEDMEKMPLEISGAFQMSVKDQVVRPAADGDSGAYTITLPRVVEAAGKFYSFYCRNADAVNAITIADFNDESEGWAGDITLNGKGDRVLLYSDGLMWHQCCAVLTATGTTPAPTEAPA